MYVVFPRLQRGFNLRLVAAPDFLNRRILGDWIVSELRFYVQFSTAAE